MKQTLNNPFGAEQQWTAWCFSYRQRRLRRVKV
jgi:hypothetical protein